MLIEKITGYEILDSRGNPTVAARVVLKSGKSGFAAVPSGASTGIYEACELRDSDKSRYNGRGTLKAVSNINEKISKCLKGEDVFAQRIIDAKMIELDGTADKSKLGANAVLAVSLAAARAAANELNIPLYRYIGGINGFVMPRPMMNILNGGAHASNNIDIQEFMITPFEDVGFREGLRRCTEVYHALGKLLKEENLACGVGDEGGYAPNLKEDGEALDFICRAIENAGYTTEQIKICLDAASSGWYKEGEYILPKRNIRFSAEELISYYKELCEKYPIISLEDGLFEDDFKGFSALTDAFRDKLQIVGDDLFVTNTERLKRGIECGAANAILVKPNQIGTLTETLDVINTAKNAGYKTVISHRSGETEDTAVADIAVAVNAGQIKTGAPARSDRVSKYNRLLIIDNEIYSN